MTRTNEAVRRAARVADVPLWQIAAKIGVSQPTMTRWLRFPLPTDKEERIMQAIHELALEREVGA